MDAITLTGRVLTGSRKERLARAIDLLHAVVYLLEDDRDERICAVRVDVWNVIGRTRRVLDESTRKDVEGGDA